MPDLGISMMDDVLSDVSRITDASSLPARKYRSGCGGASNIAPGIRFLIRAGVAAMHIEDQAGPNRCDNGTARKLSQPAKRPLCEGEVTHVPMRRPSSWRAPMRWSQGRRRQSSAT